MLTQEDIKDVVLEVIAKHNSGQITVKLASAALVGLTLSYPQFKDIISDSLTVTEGEQ